MARIECRGLTKRFGDFVAVNGLDLDIEDKEFVVLLGPSGCGKTTTLNILAGLEELDGGNVRFDDEIVNFMPPHKRNIAMVFQSYALYPHKTVYDNIAFGLKLKKVPRAEIDRRVRDAAGRLELTKLLDRRPAQLSGGQRQRVALGRAIARQPAVFLLDEPLSNLDASLRLTMRNEIKKLHQSMATTFVYVTHDQVEALSLAHRIVVMRDGEIQQVASPDEIYSRPANIFVASFLGNPPMNFISGELSGAEGRPAFRRGDLTIALPEQLKAKSGGGRDVVLGIRPEDASLQPFEGSCPLTGKLVLVSPMGPEAYVDVMIEGVELMFRVPKGSTFEGDGDLTVHIDPSAVHLFDAVSEQRLTTP